MTTYNVYCDESCHLEHDAQKVMVLGAVWSPVNKTHDIHHDLRQLKKKHGLPVNFEIKWVKVSPAKIEFYLDVLTYFFREKCLHFRALIIPDKSSLNHSKFNHDHDTWYYKMYFDMLKVIFKPSASYRVYLDIKDTRGA
nr:DUF3800 domain-containing protein [Legionellales bacterium]